MTARQSPVLASLPLFAAYLVAPMAVLAGKLAGKTGVFRQYGPLGMAPWLILAVLALLVCLGAGVRERSHQGRPRWPGALLALGMAAATLALVRFFGPAVAQAANLAPLLDELKFPALALFAGLWAWSFGPPERDTLRRLGAGLGALMALDFLLTAIAARHLVLGGGYLFGEAAGTADLLAFLLCLALSATLDTPPTADLPTDGQPADGQPTGGDRPRLARWLILTGLLASFSRAGLLTGALICLFLERGPLRSRLAAASACVLCLWVSLTLPLARLGAAPGEDLGLAWYWTATTEALRQEPRGLLLGLPLDSPVALAMPDSQGLEWEPEAEGLPVSVFEIPSSGLRLLAAWGLGAPLAVLAAALFCALRGRSRFGLGLMAALLVCAALTPVLHAPATAVALALSLCAAARRPVAPPTAGGRNA